MHDLNNCSFSCRFKHTCVQTTHTCTRASLPYLEQQDEDGEQVGQVTDQSKYVHSVAVCVCLCGLLMIDACVLAGWRVCSTH